MKKIFFGFFLFLIFFKVPDVFAVQPISCIGTADCAVGVQCPIINLVGCKVFMTRYYNNVGVSSCTTCPSGFNRVSRSISVPGCSNTITYYDCEAEVSCTKCPDCESQDWSTYITSTGVIKLGYQRKVTATCNYSTCICSKTYSYRCGNGYYGITINGTTGCSRCPANGSNGLLTWGSSVAGNNLSIAGCYVASGGDDSGDYMYSQDCYYKK